MTRILGFVTPLVALLLLGLLVLLSISGMVDPAGSAARFGVAANDPGAQFYHAVYRDRNLVLAVVGLVFLATRQWRPLAILATASVTLPVYDIYALKTVGAAVPFVHPATLIALILLTALLWWKVGAKKPA